MKFLEFKSAETGKTVFIKKNLVVAWNGHKDGCTKLILDPNKGDNNEILIMDSVQDIAEQMKR